MKCVYSIHNVARSSVVVVGGGSAGVGAAYRAAQCGANVTLLESGTVLGGTSTMGGVHCWEPGIASFGLNRVLYQRMQTISSAVCVGRTIHPYDPISHIGLNGVLPDECYEASLRRGSLGWREVARVHFEPDAMAWAMRTILEECGVRVLCSAAFIEAKTDGERICAVRAMDLTTAEIVTLAADAVIDCTADAVVCRSLGIKVRFGEDCYADFAEPSAPEVRTNIVNGVSLCFRVSPGECKEETPRWVYETEALEWIASNEIPCSNVDLYPNGDRNFNPLPLMQGTEYFSIPPEARMRALIARVWLYWEWMKQEHGHCGWHIAQIMPRAGVRESWRVCTMVTTTENDLRIGCFHQENDVIALGDHTLDTHGARTDVMCLPREVEGPYGIRAGSLQVREYSNLLVAGRCAGFSHLAASSCRLSRTMMDLGEAAGAMAAFGGDLRMCCISKVRDALDFERYLDWAANEYRRIGREGV